MREAPPTVAFTKTCARRPITGKSAASTWSKAAPWWGLAKSEAQDHHPAREVVGGEVGKGHGAVATCWVARKVPGVVDEELVVVHVGRAMGIVSP